VTDKPCVFCEIVAGRAPATIVREWNDTIAIVPLGPVVEGHILVIPKMHVSDFAEAHSPIGHYISGVTMQRASELADEIGGPMNLITSKGVEATQSVFHLHLHLVPRAKDDGLALPWYSGKGGRQPAA
jgi:histidine triad (HIT) family protein